MSATAENPEPTLLRSSSMPPPVDRIRTLSEFSRRHSESGSVRRMKEMLRSGNSVLNRGLGGFRVSLVRPEREQARSGATTLLVYGAVITVTSTLAIEIHWGGLGVEPFFNQDMGEWTDGLCCLASIPLACAALNFLIQHIRRTTFFWDEQHGPDGNSSIRRFFDPLSYYPMSLVVLGVVRKACVKMISERYGLRIADYIDSVVYMIFLNLYFMLLDFIDAVIKGMARQQGDLNRAGPVSKMQTLVASITKTGDEQKDCVYSFKRANTVPAEVLGYVWWVYYGVGKVFGTMAVVAFMMGWDSGLLSHSLVGGMMITIATGSSFLFELGPNTLSLFRLSLHKPFYVGDLVTLNTTGAMNSPESSIMGFVENITMMYVVIRNFEMKQTWIPHRTFSSMIIQNWTRRPSKTVLLNIGISCRCPVKKVRALKDFGMRWIEASNEIQQKNYRKCHITKTSNGYNIEVIFFPTIGTSHRGIRQKFLVAFMAAAERMQIPFVPQQLISNFCDVTATAPKDDPGLPEDLNLDDLLPNPEERLPKGVGNGFKEYPEAVSKRQEQPTADDDVPDPDESLPNVIASTWRSSPRHSPVLMQQEQPAHVEILKI